MFPEPPQAEAEEEVGEEEQKDEEREPAWSNSTQNLNFWDIGGRGVGSREGGQPNFGRGGGSGFGPPGGGQVTTF